ncbi:hypothetical protein [Massilia sp. Root1485]|uniref:hypothetical protein n=1 Tax=Massilia sp. Root1485 TaxID=1736472 RepID=UPI0006F5F49A|nr:hypothetical protein [Massilia sp. Root1485]KQZ34307.1 hypothetical protein ASD92_08315 [Massilia sp. Root1485]
MTRLQILLLGALVSIALAVGAWVGVDEYGDNRYRDGYDAAVTAGIKQRDLDAEENRKAESDLRVQLATRDADAYRKEQEYASNLADAQRRVRAGTDRLRCPAASTVQPGTQTAGRPAAGGSAPDGGGPDLVPEVAAEILGDGAAVAGLVSRYERLEQRFEACRTVNARP